MNAKLAAHQVSRWKTLTVAEPMQTPRTKRSANIASGDWALSVLLCTVMACFERSRGRTLPRSD